MALLAGGVQDETRHLRFIRGAPLSQRAGGCGSRAAGSGREMAGPAEYTTCIVAALHWVQFGKGGRGTCWGSPDVDRLRGTGDLDTRGPPGAAC